MSTVNRTLYEILGVAPTASAAEIRNAYLKLVARYHPDRHEGNPLAGLAADEVAALNHAYEVLSDPARRANYDRELAGAGPVRSAAAVQREVKALVVLLRVLALAVAIAVLARFVPLVWRGAGLIFRLAGEALAALGGTPAATVAVVLAAAGAAALVWRRRRRKK